MKGDLRREELSACRKELHIRASEMETWTHTPPGQAPRTQRGTFTLTMAGTPEGTEGQGVTRSCAWGGSYT